MAVAYAAMEEEFVTGTAEARAKFGALVVQATAATAVVDEGPDAGNPFGPDPARLASMTGQPDAQFAGLIPPASAAGR